MCAANNHPPACPLRRDEALSAIQTALRDQQQQELTFDSEMTGYRKDITKQQVGWRLDTGGWESRNKSINPKAETNARGQGQCTSLHYQTFTHFSLRCSPTSHLQVQNEQLTAILKKVEGESQFVAKQIAGMLEKGERLQEVYSKLARSLEQTESQVSGGRGYYLHGGCTLGCWTGC